MWWNDSLYLEMKELSALQALIPDSLLYASAECHAEESGKAGTTGHERKSCKSYFMGECCEYSRDEGLGIVLNLLKDVGVESLGHRHICLSSKYNYIGVSVQPHIIYGFNSVEDFK